MSLQDLYLKSKNVELLKTLEGNFYFYFKSQGLIIPLWQMQLCNEHKSVDEICLVSKRLKRRVFRCQLVKEEDALEVFNELNIARKEWAVDKNYWLIEGRDGKKIIYNGKKDRVEKFKSQSFYYLQGIYSEELKREKLIDGASFLAIELGLRQIEWDTLNYINEYGDLLTEQ